MLQILKSMDFIKTQKSENERFFLQKQRCMNSREVTFKNKRDGWGWSLYNFMGRIC